MTLTSAFPESTPPENYGDLLWKIDMAEPTIDNGKIYYRALRAAIKATELKNPAPISPAFGDGWKTAMMTVLDVIEKEIK